MAATELVDPEDYAKRTARKIVARWMLTNGFATGHGDSLYDLLRELEGQVNELKFRLQAEAPEDAEELDEISLATDIHEMVLCMAPETPIEDQAFNLAKHLLKYWRMTWRGDTARTQAEAQAPASVTTLRCVACKREFGQPAPAPTMPTRDDVAEELASTPGSWFDKADAILALFAKGGTP